MPARHVWIHPLVAGVPVTPARVGISPTLTPSSPTNRIRFDHMTSDTPNACRPELVNRRSNSLSSSIVNAINVCDNSVGSGRSSATLLTILRGYRCVGEPSRWACHYGSVFEVTQQITINQPVERVRAQFGDVAHHERTGVHRGVTFTVVAERPDYCEYQQTTRMGFVRIRQSFRLERDDPACQVNVLTAGAFTPGSITFEIEPTAIADTTVVTATLRAPLRGVTARLAPLLRPALARSLAKALREDRRDLESGAYPRSPTN
jgi:hypothetical protein